MNGSTKVYAVLLMDEVWSEPQLKAALEPYVQNGRIGKYFHCRKVDTSDIHYFSMITNRTDDGKSFEAEILIPHTYVKLLLCSTESDNPPIGFSF